MAEPSQKQGDPSLPKSKDPSAGAVDSVGDEGDRDTDAVQSDSDDAEDDEEEEDDEDDEGEEEEEEEEPKLKYARLTSYLAPVYRNGDATSAFLVAGDKMVRLDPVTHYTTVTPVSTNTFVVYWHT